MLIAVFNESNEDLIEPRNYFNYYMNASSKKVFYTIAYEDIWSFSLLRDILRMQTEIL